MKESTETVFIGDIHGHAPTLLALLDQLGWRQRDRHLAGPGGQKLVLIGDLIDRGPQNLHTVDIVRDLVERGDALCLMGNHEFNAVQLHTPRSGKSRADPASAESQEPEAAPGRARRDRAGPGDWKEMLDWFRTRPLAVEGDGWRCVHACWHPPSLETLEERDGQWFLAPDAWLASVRRGNREFKAVESLLTGPERKLLGGASFLDKEGSERAEACLRWWEPAPAPAPTTLGEALLFRGAPEGLDLDTP